MTDILLIYLSVFFVLISPVMIGLAIYGIFMVARVFSGVLIEWNETHLIPQEEELPLEERLQIDLDNKILEAEEYKEDMRRKRIKSHLEAMENYIKRHRSTE